MTEFNTPTPEDAYDLCGSNHESNNEVDIAGPELNAYMIEDDQPPTASTKMLYNRLGASSEPIWAGPRNPKYNIDVFLQPCGVCVKGSNYVNGESDYFGRLVKVIQIQYPGWPVNSIVLFKCEWFDSRPGVGTKINPKYPSLIEVNEKKIYNENDIFVLATQTTQVCYVNYSSLRRDKQDWLAIVKVKARAIVDIPISNNVEPGSTSDLFQDDESESHPIQIKTNDETELLIDDSATQLNIMDVQVEDDSDEDENQNEYFDLTEDY
ncbi:hypothetical protein F3Y22_tig00111000pilonHSYRG00126 [Hibiscus syriacus]|uniref:DUF4216 domain-containing protein n=1 Tax=Hibiscus syriacus TaxID=106335 RepID=A0A6A2Z8C3_HIBSY|nr:hypothetical protein F3Y22_tig00111000pilonHSYRG00126 [Hibiscus syriacus]